MDHSKESNSGLWKMVNMGMPVRKGSHVIPVRKLERFLRYSSSLDKLCKAMAYSLSVPLNKRDTKEWDIFWSVSNYQDMDYVAVYSVIEPLRGFQDIVAVDFSILGSEEGLSLLEDIPQVKDVLISELSMVIYGK